MTERRVALRVVRAGGDPAETLSATLRVTFDGEPVQLTLAMPSGELPLHELMPVLHGLGSLMADIGTERVERDGLAISCRKGCGACCRQPVPITESEALALAGFVSALPEPRQSELRARWAAALARLDAAGVLEALRHPTELEGPELGRVGREYFALGVPCPFLEAESCSIHPHRPLACREFLVTSAPLHCAPPADEAVRRVPLPASTFQAVHALDRRASSSAGWTILVLALEHAERQPPPIERQSLAWVRDLFAEIGTPKQPKR